jgi:hypothetical protein
LVKATSIVAGPEVRVVNVSRRGILFASEVPISPGMRVHVRLIAAGVNPIILKGTILRSKLETLQEGQPTYHSAVAIDQDFPFLGPGMVAADAEEAAAGSPERAPATESPAQSEGEVLALTALLPEGRDVSQLYAESI